MLSEDGMQNPSKDLDGHVVMHAHNPRFLKRLDDISVFLENFFLQFRSEQFT